MTTQRSRRGPRLPMLLCLALLGFTPGLSAQDEEFRKFFGTLTNEVPVLPDDPDQYYKDLLDRAQKEIAKEESPPEGEALTQKAVQVVEAYLLDRFRREPQKFALRIISEPLRGDRFQFGIYSSAEARVTLDEVKDVDAIAGRLPRTATTILRHIQPGVDISFTPIDEIFFRFIADRAIKGEGELAAFPEEDLLTEPQFQRLAEKARDLVGREREAGRNLNDLDVQKRIINELTIFYRELKGLAAGADLSPGHRDEIIAAFTGVFGGRVRTTKELFEQPEVGSRPDPPGGDKTLGAAEIINIIIELARAYQNLLRDSLSQPALQDKETQRRALTRILERRLAAHNINSLEELEAPIAREFRSFIDELLKGGFGAPGGPITVPTGLVTVPTTYPSVILVPARHGLFSWFHHKPRLFYTFP